MKKTINYLKISLLYILFSTTLIQCVEEDFENKNTQSETNSPYVYGNFTFKNKTFDDFNNLSVLKEKIEYIIEKKQTNNFINGFLSKNQTIDTSKFIEISYETSKTYKFRTVSSSGFPATIELVFPEIWANTRIIKFH